MRFPFIVIAAAALAACDRPSPVADGAENASALPVTNKPAASPTGGPPAPENRTEPSNAAAPAAAIPASLQGRWGLTPRDCSAPISNSMGLLVINDEELRFYESRAVPAANIQTSTNSISGDFAFTGEGQQWSKHLSLELRDGKLVRTEREPLAAFRYVRC